MLITQNGYHYKFMARIYGSSIDKAPLNGGIIGRGNAASKGGGCITGFTSSGNFCSGSTTRMVETFFIGGGGGGKSNTFVMLDWRHLS